MRNRRHIILLTLSFFASAVSAFAQQYVKGEVVEKKSGAPIPGAFVVGLSDSVQKAYAFSDAQGRFELKVPAGTEVQTIRASMMGYETKAMPVSSKAVECRIALDEKITQIASSRKTGQVAEKRGDTLSYYAGAFADGTEKALGELLEKIPEITVTESGGILHKGQYINKFYVEGLDLMGSRYGVATKNLRADDIAKIEVYQNHQPIRALAGMQNSEKSAVNIILKSGVRNTWLLSADAMLGLPEFPLFDVRTMLSRFGKETQSLLLAKGNNTGGDIAGEIREQEYFGRTGAFLVSNAGLESDFSSALNPHKNFLALPREYWFDNLSGIASMNHLGKAGQDGLCRLSLHVAGEEDTEELTRQETILLQDGTSVAITETFDATDRKRYFNAGASFEKNNAKRFLSNILSVSGQARTFESGLNAYDAFNQGYKLPSLKIENNLAATFRTGDRRALHLRSDAKYIRNDHRARYTSGSADYRQDLLAEDFFTDNTLTINAKIRRHQIRLSPGISAGYTGRKSSLEGPVIANADMKMYSVTPYFLVGGAINIGALQIDYDLPASLHLLNEKSLGDIVFPSFSPSVRFKYTVREFEFRSRLSYDDSRSGPESLLTTPVMSNYRSLGSQDSLRRTQFFRVNAAVNYSNLPMRFFVTLSGGYAGSAADRSMSSTYNNTLSVLTYLPALSRFSAYNANLSMEKFFGARFLAVRGDLGYTASSREEYLQNQILNISEDGIHVEYNIRLRPAEWISLQTRGIYRRTSSRSVVSVATSSFSSDNMLHISPFKKLAFDTQAWYLYERVPGTSTSNPLLIKTELSYDLPKAKLFLECRNLLNAKEYRREYVSAYSSFSSVSALRGRSVLAGIRMSL